MMLFLVMWICLVINVQTITGQEEAVTNASDAVTNASDVTVVESVAPEAATEAATAATAAATEPAAATTPAAAADPAAATAPAAAAEPATGAEPGAMVALTDSPDNPRSSVTVDSEEHFANGSGRVLDDIFGTRVEVWCKLQANTYNCHGGGVHERYYYDLLLEDCRLANVGAKCSVDLNVFSSITACRSACRDFGQEVLKPHKRYGFNVTCRLQPDFGNCNGYYPRYFFSVSEKACRGFSFSGCGGNKNRFDTYDECKDACEPVVNEF